MLSKLKATLDKRYGAEWPHLELETISLDLGFVLTPVMLSQLTILRAVGEHPQLFENDASYFLRFVEAANAHAVDPTVAYMPNVLELAWGLMELKRILPGLEYSNAIQTICRYILNDEGFEAFPPPFDFLAQDSESRWESEEQKENRAKAIRLYALAMERM